jgi:hypothetical protein
MIAMDGSKHLYYPSHDVPVVPDPISLVGKPGVTDATWSSIGDMPAGVSQGWKLYVPATLANYVSTLKVVGPVFFDNGIPFKYLSSSSRVRDLNAGLFGFSQVGKCIVGYLHDSSKIPTARLGMRARLYRGFPRLGRVQLSSTGLEATEGIALRSPG